MRWTSRPSTRIIATWIVIAIGSILACAILLAGTPPDKHLAVYSVAANYSLPLVQREGRLYVGLLEVLEPLGKVSAKSEGKGWRLHYNNVEGDFQIDKTRARVQGRDADLGGKFLGENSRGLGPVGSLPSLPPPVLRGPVTPIGRPARRAPAFRAATPISAGSFWSKIVVDSCLSVPCLPCSRAFSADQSLCTKNPDASSSAA